MTDYAIEFRTLAATSQWNPEALAARFLDELVEDIKDEIYACEPPGLLDDLISSCHPS